MTSIDDAFAVLPILDLSLAHNSETRPELLKNLRAALFHVGFLYVTNHGIPAKTIDNLTSALPSLFDLPMDVRSDMSKIGSPHFLGYSGFAEEVTLGKHDLREQFDMATELPVVWQSPHLFNGNIEAGDRQPGRDFTKLYWRLRGPNQWPPENLLPGFKSAFIEYHDAVADLSYRFVHLVEEALGIPVGTFDTFFAGGRSGAYLPPQHRIKLLKYPPSPSEEGGLGVGPHRDSSGWLTFLYQVGEENALEVVNATGDWIPAPPIKRSFVVNFGNAFAASTGDAVRATIHRVKATTPTSPTRYSIPFFQGLPLDLTVSQIRSYMPEAVKSMRSKAQDRVNGPSETISSFLDPRWDSLGESQLRKWIRSHPDVALRWYGVEAVDYYTKA